MQVYIVIDGESDVEGNSQEIVAAFSTEKAAQDFIQTLLPKLPPSTKASERSWLRNQHEFGCHYLEIQECPLDDYTIPDDYRYITCPACNGTYFVENELCEKCDGTGSVREGENQNAVGN